MTSDRIQIKNIKSIDELDVTFNYPESNIIVVSGRNGTGKTTLIKCLKLLEDASVFKRSSGLNTIRENSSVILDLSGEKSVKFSYNPALDMLDTKDRLPRNQSIIAELPIPYGKRFEHFELISSNDSEIRANIAAGDYQRADDLIDFLSAVYGSGKFDDLKVARVKRHDFYFILLDNDYYIREDHFSSGEFFLVQIYRFITNGASLIVIDELDVALDAAAQVSLYSALKKLISENNSRAIVVSHSLAFMSTVNEDGLYFLENNSLERRSFGFIKSNLYGFKGRDRYILTEDHMLEGFLNYLVRKHIKTFFQLEIIPVGGQPQIDSIALKNDQDEIFGDPDHVAIFIDGDIKGQIKYRGASQVIVSPIEDIEVYLWRNKDRLLPDVELEDFTPATKEKNTAKTYWKKVVRSGQKTKEELYSKIENEFRVELTPVISKLKDFLGHNL